MLTREQRYAIQAYTDVKTIRDNQNLNDEQRQKYGAIAHKLPVLVRTAGLVQALAFLDARGTGAQTQLLVHLAQSMGHSTGGALLDKSRTAPLSEYMRLTHEVLAALTWYKRYVQSMLGVDAADEGGEA
ncbi:MAG TPA: type III-B CRISPR module-associated protein Cmr5 [Chloroflexia bacterium]|nr:type III-B CRISPR module-associated protein Cmr5 [Chloroflexia bacterium]